MSILKSLTYKNLLDTIHLLTLLKWSTYFWQLSLWHLYPPHRLDRFYLKFIHLSLLKCQLLYIFLTAVTIKESSHSDVTLTRQSWILTLILNLFSSQAYTFINYFHLTSDTFFLLKSVQLFIWPLSLLKCQQ